MSTIDHLDNSIVVNISGALAFALQAAHPLVAAGVASTGKFQLTPRRRLQHTSQALRWLTTSSPDKAKHYASHLAKLHNQIKGVLTEDVGMWKAGTVYSACDPQLLLWVYATLVVSRVRVFSVLVRSPTMVEKEEFYKSTYTFGELFGIDEELRPSSYRKLVEYYDSMVGTLAVGTDGYALVQALLTGIGPGAGVVKAIIAGLLPSNVCIAYGFPWNRWRKLQAHLCGILVINLLPLVNRFRRPWYIGWSLRSTS